MIPTTTSKSLDGKWKPEEFKKTSKPMSLDQDSSTLPDLFPIPGDHTSQSLEHSSYVSKAPTPTTPLPSKIPSTTTLTEVTRDISRRETTPRELFRAWETTIARLNLGEDTSSLNSKVEERQCLQLPTKGNQTLDLLTDEWFFLIESYNHLILLNLPNQSDCSLKS